MYKVLNIGGWDYKLEYTIEASLYSNCVTSIMGLLSELNESKERQDTKRLFSGIANVPQTAITIFYAGLLEHHGEAGDMSVMSPVDAKRLVAQYLKEHKEEETGNFYGILNLCIEQMGEDGFFKLIGMDAMADAGQKKELKKPRDRQRKAVTIEQ